MIRLSMEEPFSFPPAASMPLVAALQQQKKRRRDDDDKMDECRKSSSQLFYSPSLSSSHSPSSSLSSLRLSDVFAQQLDTLPSDVILRILSFLSPRQLLLFSCLSTRFRTTVSNPLLWNSIKIDDSDSPHIKSTMDPLSFESFKKINHSILSMVREVSLLEPTCRKFNDGRHFSRSVCIHSHIYSHTHYAHVYIHIMHISENYI